MIENIDIDSIILDLKKGVAEIIDEARIRTLIKNYYEKGEVFYVKAGFDPTAPDLHLGHTVVLQKMAFLQKHGAYIQFVIGDFTGQIGDPTGKNETRKQLDYETVLLNAKTYEAQVFKILDRKSAKIYFNSNWLNELGSIGMVDLTSRFNVARMLERDDFTKRFKNEAPISISEFLYPLLQGYDSVALRSDIEMGGTDQKFNLLMGRHLQRSYGIGKEQAVIMMPLLVGTDGVAKMSKSYNNYIGVSEDPNVIYGKVMSISDGLMWQWYNLVSERLVSEISTMIELVSKNELHPKTAKEDLAQEIISRFFNEDEARKAKIEFDNVHSLNQIPNELEEIEISAPAWIVKALTLSNLATSGSDARRLIKANAVSIDQEKISDENMFVEKGEYVLQVGKKKFIKLRVV